MPTSRGPCRDFLAEFSNFVDGTLDPDRRALLLAHLDCCEACLRHLTAYRQGIAAYRAASAPVPAWGLYERVMERLGDLGPVRRDKRGERDVASSRSHDGVVGAALVMAVVAMLLFMPPFGLDFRAGTSGTETVSSDVDDALIGWANVMPTALPVMNPAKVERAVIEPSPRNPSVAEERAPTVDAIPEVPRREVRVLRVNDIGSGMRARGIGDWSPRRPPIVVRHATAIMPAAWVAGAALRIP